MAHSTNIWLAGGSIGDTMLRFHFSAVSVDEKNRSIFIQSCIYLCTDTVKSAQKIDRTNYIFLVPERGIKKSSGRFFCLFFLLLLWIPLCLLWYEKKNQSPINEQYHTTCVGNTCQASLFWRETPYFSSSSLTLEI